MASFAASNFKAKKEHELKASASKDHNWNTLFVRDATVADAIADSLNISKGTCVIYGR